MTGAKEAGEPAVAHDGARVVYAEQANVAQWAGVPGGPARHDYLSACHAVGRGLGTWAGMARPETNYVPCQPEIK